MLAAFSNVTQQLRGSKLSHLGNLLPRLESLTLSATTFLIVPLTPNIYTPVSQYFLLTQLVKGRAHKDGKPIK